MDSIDLSVDNRIYASFRITQLREGAHPLMAHNLGSRKHLRPRN